MVLKRYAGVRLEPWHWALKLQLPEAQESFWVFGVALIVNDLLGSRN